jgi:DNA polymerase III epsilon subunit-like protein
LKEKLYQECLSFSNRYNGVDGFWDSLALQHGFENSEKLRSAFRRERKARNDFEPQRTMNIDSHDVVIFDIETLPLKGYAWDTWKTDITPVQLIDDWIICSWAAKDLMREEVRSDVLTPREAKNRNDKRIIKSLWKEFENASILIGHNIVNFDIPKSNTRFLYYRMNPPAPYRAIDTYRILKYNFRFTYNRLNFINGTLGLTEKVDNEGFPLWIKCSEGDPQALDDMRQYNCGDILSEEELYLAIRGWDNRSPNIGLFFDDAKNHCKNCGSENLEDLDKPYRTQIGEYQAKRCGDCGAINRCAKSSISKQKRESLLR